MPGTSPRIALCEERAIRRMRPYPRSNANACCGKALACAKMAMPDWVRIWFRVEFSVDPELGRVIVKIMDGESGTVIRQIPQQEVLDLAKSLETPTGLLLHHKV